MNPLEITTEAERGFQQAVKQYLCLLSADLTQVLRQLIQHSYPEDVVELAFELFPDGFSEGFPVQTFFLDADNSEVFIMVNGEAQYPSPVEPELLENPQVYPWELESNYAMGDNEFNAWGIASYTLIDWFFDCWQQAGGKHFPLKAKIGVHDSRHQFDLIKGQWHKG
ncbi:hypothetical protein L2725_20300 [Shewanella corallii]|uniref:Uncharacterized protein n=1 Tax=Shewanella corallii TaxID=560080 RepID=A0ABT0NE65_9GAMM|nr:hypothetical protein [Shewanella corallii]MCL2916087.1 hypothetical protein [Shewanella corallii]